MNILLQAYSHYLHRYSMLESLRGKRVILRRLIYWHERVEIYKVHDNNYLALGEDLESTCLRVDSITLEYW